MKVTTESKPSPQIIERDCRNVMGRKAGYSARNNRRTLRKGMGELTSGQAIADGYERSGYKRAETQLLNLLEDIFNPFRPIRLKTLIKL